MNTHDLSRELSIFREIRQRIQDIYGLEDGDEALTDTAIGETNIEETIARVLREAKATEAMRDGLHDLMAAMSARQQRLDNKAERLRAIASWAMSEIGISKLQVPDMTVNLRTGKPKLIIEEGSLAAEFIREVITTKPDRPAIQAAVDRGDVPAGVSITNSPPILTIRTK